MKTGVLILSHARARKVATIKALRHAGYTGSYWVIVDDRDPQLELYQYAYGKRLITFSKDEYAQQVDEMFNPGRPQATPLYARQAAWDIAEQLGLDVFLLLDDDYQYFWYVVHDERGLEPSYGVPIHRFDDIFRVFTETLASMPPNVVCLAFCQSGDNVGKSLALEPKYLRKAMNAFFLMPSRRFDWRGIFNDDVCTVLDHTMRGKLFFTTPLVMLKQRPTQHTEGGISRLYRDYGTYTKSLYPVMLAPSAVRVEYVRSVSRVHHTINWNGVAPCIVRDGIRAPHSQQQLYLKQETVSTSV
jgi:hypothetical protein